MFFPRIFLWYGVYISTHVSAQTTRNDHIDVDLFIHNMDPGAGWAASIQKACDGSTTYVVSCTSAPLNNACSPQTATITEGPNFYIATTPAIYSETSATMTESCSLNTAARSASCVATIVADMFGMANAKTTSCNLTGDYYNQYAVRVTKGAEQMENGGSCPVQVSRASGSSSGGGRGNVLVWGVVITIGVVTILVL